MRSLSLLRTGTRAFTKRPLSNLSSRCSQYLPATSSILSNQFNRTSSPSLLSFVPRANIQSVSPSAPVSHPDAPARVAIEAEVRSGKKKYYAARLREVGGVPALMMGPNGNDDKLMLAVDVKDIHRIIRLKPRSFLNQVFDLTISDPETGKKWTEHVLIKQLHRDTINHRYMNITFKKFEPNKVHRITVPILFDNLEDSKLAKVNGWPVIMYEYFECTWKGGLDIPEHISVDTINMTVGDVIRLRDCTFAPGLKPRLKPNHKNPVIATLKGSRRGLVTVEEDDD